MMEYDYFGRHENIWSKNIFFSQLCLFISLFLGNNFAKNKTKDFYYLTIFLNVSSRQIMRQKKQTNDQEKNREQQMIAKKNK